MRPVIFSPNSVAPVTRAITDNYRQGAANFDLRSHLYWSNMPIAMVRQWATFIGLGVYSRLFGEAAERRFAASTYFYYANRDRKASLDRLASDLGVHYTADFTLSGGERTAITICLSRVLHANISTVDAVEELTRMITWLLPHYRFALTVRVCENASTHLRLNVGGYALVYGKIGD